MHPLLIGFHQERPQTNIKFGQAEHGSGWRRASRRVPRLMAEEELVRGFEDALDFAASARLSGQSEIGTPFGPSSHHDENTVPAFNRLGSVAQPLLNRRCLTLPRTEG